jgi:phosphohistidine phosphatase
MKTLLILRHAKSDWGNSRLADYDRPLNERGKGDAPRMGQLLRDEELVPDLIITSSAERAQTTAELAAIASGYENEITYTRRLYHAAPDAYIELLQEMGGDHACVMVVGHNPGIAYLVELLTGADEPMPTAALAQVELPINQWTELDESTEGKLVNVWIPREL